MAAIVVLKEFVLYISTLFLFVCVEVFYGPVNLMGSCRAQSVCYTTLLTDRLSPLTSTVHILMIETDNCPS